jgi:hypothetical protein
VKFTKSTPMSQSCDLFHKGPQKHHPRALGFDYVIHDLRWLAAALEGLITEGDILDLSVGDVCNCICDACWEVCLV